MNKKNKDISYLSYFPPPFTCYSFAFSGTCKPYMENLFV